MMFGLWLTGSVAVSTNLFRQTGHLSMLFGVISHDAMQSKWNIWVHSAFWEDATSCPSLNASRQMLQSEDSPDSLMLWQAIVDFTECFEILRLAWFLATWFDSSSLVVSALPLGSLACYWIVETNAWDPIRSRGNITTNINCDHLLTLTTTPFLIFFSAIFFDLSLLLSARSLSIRLWQHPHATTEKIKINIIGSVTPNPLS